MSASSISDEDEQIDFPNTFADDSDYDEQLIVSSTWPDRPSDSDFPHTAHDQFLTFFYIKAALRQNQSNPHLNMPELAWTILEMAQYWIRNRAQRSGREQITQYDGEDVVYLRSEPVQGRAHRPVRKVVFRTMSHDQGWSSNPAEYHGTYIESYSWFQAAKESASQTTLETHAGNDRVLFEETVCRNVHASNLPRTHEVCWPAASAGSNEPEDCESYHWTQDRDEERIEEWVKLLQVGDRVCLIPRALYSGWSNTIYRAEITIYTSFLRPGLDQL